MQKRKRKGYICGFIYDVAKTIKTSSKQKAQTLYKISWCEMYLSGEGKAGAKWVIDKGTGKHVAYSPVLLNKKKAYTYLLSDYISKAVREICSAFDGRASVTNLKLLSQKEISVWIPPSLHPLTKDKTPKGKVLSHYFQRQDSNFKRMRIASSDEEQDDFTTPTSPTKTSSPSKPPCAKSPPRTNIANGFVPHGISSQVETMINELNCSYESMPEIYERKPGDVTHAYQMVLMQSSMWKNKDVPTIFPFTRFRKYSAVRFPPDVIKISKDRRKWSCRLCKDSDHETSIKHKFHRQNCLNHFRSASHCKIAAALESKGDAVTDAVLQQQQHIFAADLPRAVIDDAIVSASRKSLSLEAVRVVLDVAQRALCSVQPSNHLTVDEILTVRKVSPRAANILTRVNALTKPVTTSRGVRGPCRRGRTAITKRMLQLGKETLAKKVEHLLACKFLGITADESDTYSFSAPLAVALQGCTPSFDWANLFIGQTDVAVKRDGPGLWDKLKALLSATHPELLVLIFFSTFDGASNMRSTPKYAGLDSNPDGTSLVAQFKRGE